MFKKFIKTIALLIVLFFGGAVALLSVQLGGIRAFVVQSASMEPAILTGSLVTTQTTPPDSLKINDIITFIRPEKNREFITHRITEKYDNQGTIVFKTKGDNNKDSDLWQLAGGGVVGKVLFSLPYIGYVLSLARTKIGIAMLIIIPALFIITDEVMKIVHLVKDAKGQTDKKTKDKQELVLFLLFIVSLLGFPLTSSYSLISESTSLLSNTFTVQIQPSPSPSPTPSPSSLPSPTPCVGNTTVTISSNGSNSQNTVNVSRTCENNSNQTNTSSTVTTVETTTSTGENTASGNTGGSTTITSGDTQTTTVIENTGDTNQ